MEETNTNPLLKKKRLPGETWALPSRGLVYNPNEVLDEEVKDGEVIVYPMTTSQELMMKSADMVFQGTAIKEVISECVPQVKDVDKLLIKDVDFLMACLRLVSYGPNMQVRVTSNYQKEKIKEDDELQESINQINKDIEAITQRYSPDEELEESDKNLLEYLKERKESLEKKLLPRGKRIELSTPQDFVIPIHQFIKNSKQLTKKSMEKFEFEISGYNVKIKSPEFKNWKNVMEKTTLLSDPNLSKKELTDFVLDSIAMFIDSVDGHKDVKHIKEWLDKMLTPGERKQLKERFQSLDSWGPEFTYKDKCKFSGEEIDLSSNLNPMYFFMEP